MTRNAASADSYLWHIVNAMDAKGIQTYSQQSLAENTIYLRGVITARRLIYMSLYLHMNTPTLLPSTSCAAQAQIDGSVKECIKDIKGT